MDQGLDDLKHLRVGMERIEEKIRRLRNEGTGNTTQNALSFLQPTSTEVPRRLDLRPPFLRDLIGGDERNFEVWSFNPQQDEIRRNIVSSSVDANFKESASRTIGEIDNGMAWIVPSAACP